MRPMKNLFTLIWFCREDLSRKSIPYRSYLEGIRLFTNFIRIIFHTYSSVLPGGT